MSLSTKAIYADRRRTVARPAPRGIEMREMRPIAEANQDLMPILDELDQAIKADTPDPAAVAAIGKKLDQWAAGNTGQPAEPFAYAASAVAIEAQGADPAQHPDLKTALGALSRLVRAVASPAAPTAPAPDKP